MQVALTELRDAGFLEHRSFACGDYFVIGQGKYLVEESGSPSRKHTPIKT